ncbi:MAG: hypothetical protein E6G50_10350 [Actinobacteria bacterium]|nr:MAG: hypothetical protein E6G50_10350 [Actinomycetota bacterium]
MTMWLRCALHAHTTRSDGELEPEELIAQYEAAGFDVLAITDHWIRTEAESTEGLLVIPSSELSCRLPDWPDTHLLGFGIAHPYWTGLVPGEFSIDGVAGIEVFNAGCELETGRGVATVHWDDLLERGARCFAIAADDSHHGDLDSRFAWVWARVGKRSVDAVLEALATGSFYSSTGPEIHEVRVDDGAVEVRCTPCQRVTLCSRRQRGSSVSFGPAGYKHRGEILAESDGITAARLTIPPHVPYTRVEVVDEHGRRAWTNPLWP